MLCFKDSAVCINVMSALITDLEAISQGEAKMALERAPLHH